MNANGTGARLITESDADHEQPAWSPDGKQILFTRTDVFTGESAVWSVGRNGSGPSGEVLRLRWAGLSPT
jgi:Tol biopolymer transport system component